MWFICAYAHLLAVLFSTHLIVFAATLTIGGTFLVKRFFFLWGKKILHEWRHVTKHDDVWLRYKRKESTRRARAGVWKRCRFCRWNRNLSALLMFTHGRDGRRRGNWQQRLQTASFLSQVGLQTKQSRCCYAECACLRLAADKLAAASFMG